MSFCSSLSSPRSFSLLSKTRPSNGDYRPASTVSFTSRFRASAEILDFLSADRLESGKKQPFDPRLYFSAEEAVQHQLDALKYNLVKALRLCTGLNDLERFFTIQPTEYCWVTRRVILSSLFVEEGISPSNGFGYREVAQRKKKSSSSPWFRGSVVHGMLICRRRVDFTTERLLLGVWPIEQSMQSYMM